MSREVGTLKPGSSDCKQAGHWSTRGSHARIKILPRFCSRLARAGMAVLAVLTTLSAADMVPHGPTAMFKDISEITVADLQSAIFAVQG